MKEQNPFALLNGGDKFRYPPYCEHLMEKIEEIDIPTIRPEFREMVRYSARYLEGPHAGKYCVVTDEYNPKDNKRSTMVVKES